jgi:hypothetical protein
MTVITEGRLTFTFNTGCNVSKYDDWSFYRNQFQSVCGSEQAVDIICFEGNDIWLIEVKDYRLPGTKKVINLYKSLSKKVRDTLAGLVAAQCNANDQMEKQFAHDSLRTRRINLVFHIEQPLKISKLFPRAIDPADLMQKLKGQLKAIDAHPKIINQYTVKANMPWTVVG